MPKMHEVQIGMNRFCGPAVLSILTGRNTDDCARVISTVNGRYDVRGVYTTDLLKAAERLGFLHEPAPVGNSLFGTFIKLHAKDGMYIVSLDNHFVTVEVTEGKIFLCDNHTKEPIVGSSSARLGQKVERVDRVWKNPNYKEPPLPPPPKPKPSYTTHYTYECNDCHVISNDTYNFHHAVSCPHYVADTEVLHVEHESVS